MSYGIDSDFLGFADTASGISLQSVSNPVASKSEAQAEDSNGDVVASTLYDTQYGHQVTLSYKCAKDTSILLYDTATSKDFRLGKVVGGYAITGISGTTSNNDFTEVSFTAQSTGTSDSVMRKYDPGVTFTGGKAAQVIGFSTDTATRLTGSSFSASIDLARVLDSVGSELAVQSSKGRVEATASLVGVTGAPSGTADTGWSLSSGPSKDESNTEYATGSATVFKNLTGV